MNSLWIETTNDNKILNSLNRNEYTEVCIIGAGIFGLTTAYYLNKLNKKVIVIEKGKIGEKVSGNTTGKITSQHGLFYDHLISDFGKDFAKKYLESNEIAIKNIQNIVEENNIKCEFTIKNSYVYTTNEDELYQIEKEAQAVKSLGKKTRVVNDLDLPFKIKGAIEFTNQAQFHPRKYMKGLCDNILNKNKIYENTIVTNIKKEGDNYCVITDKGFIKAKYVVVASHYPIKNIPGLYFTKMYQSTSYVIAFRTNNKLPKDMYINVNEPFYSFRTAEYNGEQIILLCGSDHKTGKPIENNYPYEELEKKSKELYPDAEVLFRWNTRDCIGLDKVPYIGEFSSIMKNIYVATGFKKWGMTLSNVAANIITDEILGKDNKYKEIYKATRVEPIKNRWEEKNIIKDSINSILINKFKVEKENLEKIQNNNGAIIKINGENIGIYKDSLGKIHAVKPNCTHLGCLLSWNNLDKTWDCPCHGSRFDYEGKNIYEPAIKSLTKIELE